MLIMKWLSAGALGKNQSIASISDQKNVQHHIQRHTHLSKGKSSTAPILCTFIGWRRYKCRNIEENNKKNAVTFRTGMTILHQFGVPEAFSKHHMLRKRLLLTSLGTEMRWRRNIYHCKDFRAARTAKEDSNQLIPQHLLSYLCLLTTYTWPLPFWGTFQVKCSSGT